jgi:choline transporter-like protein 2/4/5
VWIQFLKYCAGCMVWFTLILVELLWIAATLLMYSKAGLISTTTFINLATHVGLTSVVNNTLSSATSSLPSWVTSTSTQYATTYTWVAYIFTVLAVLFLVLVIAMVRRVAIAINVIKEASRAGQAMPTMMLYPAFEFFLISGMGLYFFIIFSYLHTSSGLSGTVLNAYANVSTSGSSVQINTNSSVPGVNSTDLAALNSIVGSTTISAIQYAQLYHFFGLLWTNQFISGIGIMTIAGAVSSWYWTADKKSLGPHQTFLSFKRVVRYHLGSIAFGAFLIAVIQFIRAIFAYLDEKSKKLQQTNIAVKIFFKVVQCCLWCFEKCMKYINRNSYIMTAMIGCNFCSGTGKALAILVMNLAQVATMNFVGMLMLVMGKIVISATCAFVGYIILTTFPDYTAGGQFALSSTVFPIFVLTLLAYFVANAFLEVYNMSIDTIILNFCIDRRDNNGVDKPYYMGDSLRKFVDNGGSTAELVASTKKGGDDDDDVAVGKPIEDAAVVDNPLIAKAEAKDE